MCVHYKYCTIPCPSLKASKTVNAVITVIVPTPYSQTMWVFQTASKNSKCSISSKWTTIHDLILCGSQKQPVKTVNAVKSVSAVYCTCSQTMCASKTDSKNGKCSMTSRYGDHPNNITLYVSLKMPVNR